MSCVIKDIEKSVKVLKSAVVAALGLCAATLSVSCTGLFDGIYDEPERGQRHEVDTAEDTVRTTLYIEANRWDCWYYIDLHAVQRVALLFAEAGDTASIEDFSFEPYTIPTSLTDRRAESAGAGDDGSSDEGEEESAGDGEEYAYIHTYRFRILTGGGLSDYTCMDTTAVDPQPEPEQWDFAIHRNNVRTNRGAAMETEYTSLDELPANSSLLFDRMIAAGQDTTFRADTPSERDVWIDNSNMIKELIPCQSIDINEVISRWLTIEIPPIPPSFNHRGNVYLLRMSDGSVAALRLANYMSAKGVKCCMTIEVKYPY